MKKVLATGFTAIFMVILFSLSVYADNNIKVFVNDMELVCETPPYIDNGRTMVPMRKIFESLNSTVNWNSDTQTINAVKGESEIVLQIGNAEIIKNGVSEYMDAVPKVVNGTTFVPLRFVSQALDTEVQWSQYTKSVFVNSPKMYDFHGFLAASAPAGYNHVSDYSKYNMNSYENSLGGELISTLGYITGVSEDNNVVYAILEDYYNPLNKWVIFIGTAESCSCEKVYSILINKYMSVGGIYMGYADEFNIPAIKMECVCIYDDYDYTYEDLMYSEYFSQQGTVTLYDLVNNTIEVNSKDIELYAYTGWSTEPQYNWVSVPQYDNESSYSNNYGYGDYSYDTTDTFVGSTVYVTPTGKRYHYSSSCAGKNARAVTIDQAISSGKTPCKKCAD